jgi:signal transduction histidine kinase
LINLLQHKKTLNALKIAEIINKITFDKLKLTSIKARKYEGVIKELEKNNQELKELKGNLEKLVEKRTLELSKQTKLAQEAIDAKTEFLAKISHELRTPDHQIEFYLEKTIKHNSKKLHDTELSEDLKIIEESMKKRKVVTNRLLCLSDLDALRTEFKIGRNNVYNNLLEVARELSSYANEMKVTININEPSFNPISFYDYSMIKQASYELIKNAIDYSRDPSKVYKRLRKKTVSIDFEIIESEDIKDSKIQINIRDQGIGVKPKEYKVIFEYFRQGSIKTGKGAGIGLSLSELVLKAHNENLWINPTCEKGSTFCFTLPYLGR